MTNPIGISINIKITDPLDAAFIAFADAVDGMVCVGMSPHDAFVAAWKAEVEKRLRPFVKGQP